MLEEAHDTAKREHDKHVKKIRADTKAVEENIIAGLIGAPSRDYGVLQIFGGIVKAANECSASHTDTMTQSGLFFKGGAMLW